MNIQKPTKRRRGAIVICDLLRRIEWMEKRGAHGYKILSDACFSAHQFLEERARLQRKPESLLDATVIVVSRQSGLLTEDEWENNLRYLWSDKPEWNKAIDTLFERFMGHKPDRSSAEKIRAEATVLWDCIKLPYTQEQFDYLERAWQYQAGKKRKELTFEDRRLYYYQPLNFDETIPSDQANDDGEAARSELRDLLDRREDEAYGGRYGYLPGTRERASKPKSKPTEQESNPEQVAHSDQARIDAAAGELLQDIDI